VEGYLDDMVMEGDCYWCPRSQRPVALRPDPATRCHRYRCAHRSGLVPGPGHGRECVANSRRPMSTGTVRRRLGPPVL